MDTPPLGGRAEGGVLIGRVEQTTLKPVIGFGSVIVGLSNVGARRLGGGLTYLTFTPASSSR